MQCFILKELISSFLQQGYVNKDILTVSMIERIITSDLFKCSRTIPPNRASPLRRDLVLQFDSSKSSFPFIWEEGLQPQTSSCYWLPKISPRWAGHFPAKCKWASPLMRAEENLFAHPSNKYRNFYGSSSLGRACSDNINRPLIDGLSSWWSVTPW